MPPPIIDDLNKALEEGTSTISAAVKEFQEFSDSVLKGTTKFDDFVQAVNAGVKATDRLNNLLAAGANEIQRFIGDTVGLEGVSDRLTAALLGTSSFVNKLADAFRNIANISNLVANSMDLYTSYNRGMTKELYESSKAFGLNIDAIDKYRDVLTETASAYGNQAGGFMRPKDILDGIAAMSSAGIPLEKMTDSITSARGESNLLATAFLQSKALGMDLTKYMSYLADAITNQGLSTQEAAEQMSMFRLVSEKTGFTIEKVVSSLHSMSSRFSKIGMTADFGRPLLEGFTNTLKSLGLGFEDAIGLSKELSDSIAGLTTNYASAYLTFQRGGLDINTSGTALGGGIGLQARMLRAKEEGTQGELALDIAKSMKETIASMTGGRVVSVYEAEKSPELEAIYITQASMLKSLYNISDEMSQARTLDLLQQLGDSTEAGDLNLAEAIGKEMGSTVDLQNQTLSVQERIGTTIQKVFEELQSSHRDQTRESIELGNQVVKGFEYYVGDQLRAAFGTSEPTGPAPFREVAVAETPTPIRPGSPETVAAAGAASQSNEQLGVIAGLLQGILTTNENTQRMVEQQADASRSAAAVRPGATGSSGSG